MKLAGKVIVGILIVVLAGLGFIHFAPGFDLYLVRSQSMEPTINMGDLIITGPTDGNVEAGQIVTFNLNGDLVTHRIFSVDETVIQTKGDNVEDVDPWTIQSADVVGSYIFKIPYVGWVTRFVQTKIGWFITIIIPAMILVIWLAKDIVKEALRTDETAEDSPVNRG